jgi:hypothetical protein
VQKTQALSFSRCIRIRVIVTATLRQAKPSQAKQNQAL